MHCCLLTLALTCASDPCARTYHTKIVRPSTAPSVRPSPLHTHNPKYIAHYIVHSSLIDELGQPGLHLPAEQTRAQVPVVALQGAAEAPQAAEVLVVRAAFAMREQQPLRLLRHRHERCLLFRRASLRQD